VRSSGKARFVFRFDAAIGDYTATEHGRLECVTGSGELLDRHGYDVDRQVNLRVTGSTKQGPSRTATRMVGSDVSDNRTTRRASLAGCSDVGREINRVLAVRLGG
jgi:hypothetical protein